MNIDHYFTIGKPHVTQGSPCEDYALSAELQPGLVLGAVCDGCGGAFADTDVGARALAYAFKKAVGLRSDLREGWIGEGFREALLAQFAAHQFTGCTDDYLATVVGVVATQERAQVYCFGDGAVLLRYADGRRVLLEAEWWGNAPFYLTYLQHPELLSRFQEPFANGVLQPFCLKKTVFADQGGVPVVLEESAEWFDFSAVEQGLVLDFKPQEEGLEAIAVLTDGIAKVGEQSAVAAVREFTAFKNFRGGFVKRRMAKALDQFVKTGQVLRDDLSMACVWFGEEA